MQNYKIRVIKNSNNCTTKVIMTISYKTITLLIEEQTKSPTWVKWREKGNRQNPQRGQYEDRASHAKRYEGVSRGTKDVEWSRLEVVTHYCLC